MRILSVLRHAFHNVHTRWCIIKEKSTFDHMMHYCTAYIICSWILQVACVIHSKFIDADTNTMFVAGKTILVCRDDMKVGFPLGEHFVELLFNLCTRFNAYKLIDTEKALFSALVLISPGKDVLVITFCYCKRGNFNVGVIFALLSSSRKLPTHRNKTHMPLWRK